MSDSPVSENAIVMERTFDAPVDVVWKMWTQPEHFKNWYGPQGFTIPVSEMDVQVGGQHRCCMEMQTPDGGMKMWSTGEYIEIVPNQRLVYTESPADEDGNLVVPPGMEQPMTTTVTIQLEDLGGRTKMVVTHAGLPAGAQGANDGWNQAFTKMADYIAKIINAK